uniref:Uncharacterized protein n=1 Tax=Steinernema glaseri TaxID=37863 RepID=A0A1I7ZZZ2_9BILA
MTSSQSETFDGKQDMKGISSCCGGFLRLDQKNWRRRTLDREDVQKRNLYTGAVNLAKDYPLNFDFRSILEKKACAIQHMSLGSPKRDLEKERLEINPSWLRNKAVACFSQNCRKIFCACIAVEKICSENTW